VTAAAHQRKVRWSRRNHSMNREPRGYQAYITGFPCDVEENRWSMEWFWMDTDFDGFKPAECLLQEAKGNYDQFIDEDGVLKFHFTGFDSMRSQIDKQGTIVRTNPPAKLIWYFQTPRTRAYMSKFLLAAGVPSVYQPMAVPTSLAA